MRKSFINKCLKRDLFPVCFRLRPAVSWAVIAVAETTGINQTQIGHEIGVKLFYSNELRICVRDSAGGK
jgi:hypothetical protein